MKTIILFIALLPILSFGQTKVISKAGSMKVPKYVKSVDNLTVEAAFELNRYATETAAAMGKNVSVAVLDASGTIILLVRGEDVGPHNTEASRKKAYTAVSTKTSSFELMQKAAADPTAHNLNSIDDLLLLGGGVPIFKDGQLIGSLGVSGGGGGENDHTIAKKAVENLGFSIKIQ